MQAVLAAAGLQLSRMLIVDTSLRCWGSHHLPRVLLAERYLFFPDPACS